VVVTEGAPDCISSLDVGFPTISPVTIQFRDKDKSKLDHLTKRTNKIYIINDNEVPKGENKKGQGLIGAYKTADFLTRIGRNVYIVLLPREEDVDKVDLNSYVADLRKQGKSTEEIKSIFDKLISESKSYIDMLLEDIAGFEKFDDRIARISDEFIPLINDLEPLRQSHYISVAAKILDINKGELEKALKAYNREAKDDLSDEPKGKKTKKKAIFDNLVDVCLDGEDKTVYLFKEDDKYVVREFVEDDNYKYIPPEKEQVAWNISKIEDVMKYVGKDDPTLFTDLIDYHKKCSELNDDNWYKFLALWDIHTYLQEQVHITPYLYFYGSPGKGKSRTCKGITWVSYRGVCIDSLQEHHVFRMSEDANATLWFDFTNFQKTITDNSVDDVFLKRFERGSKVMRVVDPSAGAFDDSRFWMIFGPTMISSNSPIDEVLLSRCITIINQISERDFDDPIDPKLGYDLRCRLVAFRGRYIGKELPVIKKPARHRLGDILKIIYQVAELVGEKGDWLDELIKEITLTDLESKIDSKPGRAITTLMRCAGLNGNKARYPLSELVAVYNGMFHKDSAEVFHIKKRGLSNVYKELGFKTGQNTEGLSSIILDSERMEIAKRAYGIDEDNSSDTLAF